MGVRHESPVSLSPHCGDMVVKENGVHPADNHHADVSGAPLAAQGPVHAVPWASQRCIVRGSAERHGAA